MNIWERLQTARDHIAALKSHVEEVVKIRDNLDGMPLIELARLQSEVGDLEDALAENKTACTKLYDRIRMGAIPGAMDADGVSTITLEGIGRVTLVSDLHVSVKSGMAEQAHEWLDDNGHGGLIKPTINASTLKAFAKSKIASGDTLPAELFNISPFTRAQITKV